MPSDLTFASARRARELAVMKRRATGLLVVVAAAFVAVAVSAGDGSGWAGYALAVTEGSLVGGLADWFAVTALFRRPLGLPIPHTAVVRERKDQFGAALGGFVQENFLAPAVVVDRVRSARVAARVAAWSSNRSNAEAVSRSVGEAVVAITDAVRDDDMRRLLSDEAERWLAGLDIAPALGRVLRAATRDGRHHELFDALLDAAAGFLDDHREPLRARFGAESPWWLPGAVEDRIFDRLMDGTASFLRAAAVDPSHELRTAIEERLEDLAARLESGSDTELRARVDGFVQDMARHPELRAWIGSLWDDVKTSLRAQAVDPASRLRERIADAVVAAGERLARDAALQDKVDAAAESAVRYVATNYRDEVGDLVAGTIARWDGEETATKLELLLGRDLQFIRINGTVVGGLAGLAIHGVGRLLGLA